jgi:hypothetical protein
MSSLKLNNLQYDNILFDEIHVLGVNALSNGYQDGGLGLRVCLWSCEEVCCS